MCERGELSMVNATKPGDEPPIVKKQTYDQAFFLDLAMKGKNLWNAWRRDPANKDIYVTFAHTDFSEAPKDEIDFTDFQFGDCANFSKCKWRGADLFHAGDDFAPGRASFADASFGAGANFEGAIFGDFAKFAGATFGWKTSFAGTYFGQYANFTGAVFDDQATFVFAIFDFAAQFDAAHFEGVSFRGATFGEGGSFSGAVIQFSDFDGAAFGDWIDFSDTSFNGDATFSGTSITRWTAGLQSVVRDFDQDDRRALEKRHEDSRNIYDSAPDRFLKISFQNARFEDDANFSGRDFQHHANFNDVQFCHPPDFDAVTNASRIDLTGARITLALRGIFPSDSEDVIRLRAFRKLAEETRNHDLERDLFLREREVELGVYLQQLWNKLYREGWKDWPKNASRLFSRIPVILIMVFYWALADYGRSFLRPLAWLVASGFFFYSRYLAVLRPQMQMMNPNGVDRYREAVQALAIGNTVPFIGPLTIDADTKRFLLCPAGNCHSPLIPPEGYQWLMLSQNLISIILVFFIGLALRNYFKIK